MTDLNEKLKLVAEYDGCKTQVVYSAYHKKEVVQDNYQCGVFYNSEYHASYDRQIPVWQKVCNEGVNIDIKNVSQEDYNKWSDIRDKFLNRICFNSPLESFEILVQAIQFINNLKQK